MAAHVMVLANRTAAAQELVDALVHRAERGPIAVTLVMPAPASQERLEAALQTWREAGIERCNGIVSQSGPFEALTEAWDPLRYDEVVVCTLPGESSRWIRSDLPHSVARYTGVAMTHVVAREPEAARPGLRPADPREGAAGTVQRAVLGRAQIADGRSSGRTAPSAARPRDRHHRARDARSASAARGPR